MAFTAAEEARILAIETILNDLLVALNNLAGKEQLSQLLLLKQKEVISLTQRVTTLESMVTLLQNKI